MPPPTPPLQSTCLSSPAPAASDTRLLFLNQSLAKSPSRPRSHRKSLLAFQVPGSSSGFQRPKVQQRGPRTPVPGICVPFLGHPLLPFLSLWAFPSAGSARRALMGCSGPRSQPHVTHLLPQPSSSSGLSGPCETLLLPCTFSRPCVLACSFLLD